MFYVERSGVTNKQSELNDYNLLLGRLQKQARQKKEYRKYFSVSMQVKSRINTWHRFDNMRII